MEEALSCIGKMPIFSGIREEELYTLIKCCDGQMAVFEKDQWIFQAILPQLSVFAFLYYRTYSIINISKNMGEAVRCQVHTVHYV